MRKTLLFLMLLYTGIGNASDAPILSSPCPGLVSSHDVDKFESALVVTDNDFASVEDCEQLGGFFLDSSMNNNYTLDHAAVAAIVDSIWQPRNEEAPFLLVEAILSWVKGLGLEQHAESLNDFISEYMPAEESIRLFFTIIIWLIVIATCVLILHEFYRAGMLKLPSLQRTQANGEKLKIRPLLSWEGVLILPLREQISALLRYSIEHLEGMNLIPSSSSYTNWELITYLEKSDIKKASLLRAQIDLTEPVVYGDEPVLEDRVAACRVKARSLSDA